MGNNIKCITDYNHEFQARTDIVQYRIRVGHMLSRNPEIIWSGTSLEELRLQINTKFKKIY